VDGDLGELDRRITERLEAARVPGAALAVVRDGRVVHARGFGVTGVEPGGVPVTPETLFRIGSTTKPLTGTAVMRLVELGVLDLDRPVGERLDWFAPVGEGAAGISLRMLLSHSAGLPNETAGFGPRDPEALERSLRAELAGRGLAFPAGRLYYYSNLGFRLAGHLAEKAAGRHFAALLQELVFDPLGMGRTTFDPTVAMTYPLAQMHELDAGGRLRVLHRFTENAARYPAGGAISTVLDLARLAIMHLGGGRFEGARMLSPESVRAMHSSQVDLRTLAGAAYGLAFRLERHKGVRIVGHAGRQGTFDSRFIMAPDQGAAAILLSNRITARFPAQALALEALDRLLGLPETEPPPRPVEPDRSAWPLAAGDFIGSEVGLARVRAEGERLALELNGEKIALDAFGPDLYFGSRAGGGRPVSVGFLPEPAGPVRFITVDGEPCERAELPAAPDPARLETLAGVYRDRDALTVSVREGRLAIRSEDQGREFPCIALGAGRFACGLGLVEFDAGADGRVFRLRLKGVLAFPRKG